MHPVRIDRDDRILKSHDAKYHPKWGIRQYGPMLEWQHHIDPGNDMHLLIWHVPLDLFHRFLKCMVFYNQAQIRPNGIGTIESLMHFRVYREIPYIPLGSMWQVHPMPG